MMLTPCEKNGLYALLIPNNKTAWMGAWISRRLFTLDHTKTVHVQGSKWSSYTRGQNAGYIAHRQCYHTSYLSDGSIVVISFNREKNKNTSIYSYFLPFFRLLASRLGADTLTLLIMVLIASMSGTLLMSSFSRAVDSDEFKNTDCACFRAIG